MGNVLCSEYNNLHFNATVFTLQNSAKRESQQKAFVTNASNCTSLSSCKTQFYVSHPPQAQYFLHLHIVEVFGRNSPVYQYPHEIRK